MASRLHTIPDLDYGLLAERPTDGPFEGRFWYSTDIQRLDYDNGTAWVAALDLANSHLSGAGPPGVGTGDGYPIGSVYADTTADEGYVLTDNTTGANVWSTATGASFAAITGVPEDNANISAFGASLIDDADAAAARTTLDAARAMLSGAGAPGVATGDGYPIGTVYADTTADEGYVLTDNSAGANVWSSATGTGGGGGGSLTRTLATVDAPGITNNSLIAASNTTGSLLDYSTVGFANVLVYINGLLMANGTSESSNLDVYPSGTAASGEFMAEFDLETGDVIQMVTVS